MGELGGTGKLLRYIEEFVDEFLLRRVLCREVVRFQRLALLEGRLLRGMWVQRVRFRLLILYLRWIHRQVLRRSANGNRGDNRGRVWMLP